MNGKRTNSTPANRRTFLKDSAAIGAAGSLVTSGHPVTASTPTLNCNFGLQDSLVLPQDWESLNPGYWQIKDGALRRRLTNVGDRARRTGFPFHYMSKGTVMPTEYDPSQPAGMAYVRSANLTGRFKVTAKFTYLQSRPDPIDGDDRHWKMHADSYGKFGLAFGAKSILESHSKARNVITAAWDDSGQLKLVKPGKRKTQPAAVDFQLEPGQQITFELQVQPVENGNATVEWIARTADGERRVSTVMQQSATNGYVGILGCGTIDFQLDSFQIESDTERTEVQSNDCLVCYPLGDTLGQNSRGEWHVRFVGLFASDGETAEIRVSESPSPSGGWKTVPVAGKAKIVNHEWRRNTATVNVNLPVSPAEKTLYYTIWKDGVDVTTDTRIGSPQVGPGTGLVGDVPSSGSYVGRLPRLQAPYKLCGLSCHAITSGLQTQTDGGYKMLGGGSDWQFRDQPTEGSYRHLDEYNFQIMVWEDDVWYMELVLYPPSTDDAYKIVTQTIAGPTSRWQMMRHWNIINPGDHDYGMDDVKGPEQLAIRRIKGLGQDITYMQRNFKIVHHLITGDEQVDPLTNPKKWRAWKMPAQDFTLVILDSRLWRSSQDTDIWDDSGWEKFKNLYDRTDPTRSLLGEEQFAWFQELVTTDTSRLMCVTGINGIHTIWTGGRGEFESGRAENKFSQRDRVTADYAGWVKAGADRVLELLGSRDGIVTVYGDVHNGCIMTNQDHRVIECSFGPIGRSGGRGVIPGFGPHMKDVDGRDVQIHALYHKSFSDPTLKEHPAGTPYYWNFLEMEFDPSQVDPAIGLRVRNLVDSPKDSPRGGAPLETTASHTGRQIGSRLPPINTLPNADVRFATPDGRPIRGTRSLANGAVPVTGLVDIQPGQTVLMTAYNGSKIESKIITTM